MYPRSSPELLKWMKPISAVSGRTNEDQSEIRDPNEDEVQRNNRYSGSSVCQNTAGMHVTGLLSKPFFSGLFLLLIVPHPDPEKAAGMRI
jgi:hypothetical protein